MPAELRSTSHGRTMVLTLHHPERRNASSPEMYAAGVEALNAAGDNPDVRSVVIVGDGRHFCSGVDLPGLQSRRQRAPGAPADGIDGLHMWIEEIRTFPKPVIAAVEGAAAGAGFSLALACDFIVAARDAVFAMASVRAGLSPDGGGTWELARALPRQCANEFAMLGGQILAERLAAHGIVNRVTASGDAFAAALDLATELNALPSNVLASTKELITEAPSTPLGLHLRKERDHFVRNLHHANAGAGIDAFITGTVARFD